MWRFLYSDDDQIAWSEGETQQRFLRRCCNLDWARANSATLERAPVTILQPALQPPFGKLESFNLTTIRVSETMLCSLGVIMQALDGSGAINDGPTWSGVTLVSVSVGGWNLPALKIVEIDVQNLSYLKVGWILGPVSQDRTFRVTRSGPAATGSWSPK